MKGLTLTVFLSTRSAPFAPSTLSVQSIILQSLEYFINVLPFAPTMFLERDRMEMIFQKLKIKEVKCHSKARRYFGQPTAREACSAGSPRATLEHQEQQKGITLQVLEGWDLDSSLFSNAICASFPHWPRMTYVFLTRWHQPVL